MDVPEGSGRACGWTGLPEWFVEKWGRVAGRIHALAKRYPSWLGRDDEPTEGEATPSERSASIGWRGIRERLAQGASDAPPEVLEKWNAIAEQMESSPICRGCYGLVHVDLGAGNILVDGESCTVIDFWPSPNWFLLVIAAAMWDLVGKDHEDCREFIRSYKKGYDTENTLSSEWWQRVPLFLKNREVMFCLLVWSWRNDDDPNADKRKVWVQAVYERAMSDASGIDFDFSTL